MASGPPRLMPSVAPSGAALATASVPMLPPAPGLFSTTKREPGARLQVVGDDPPDQVRVEPGA